MKRALGIGTITCTLLFAQPSAERPSMFAGTHFFVGFLQNEIERGSSLRLQLSIAARSPATVWVYLPTESQPRQYRLPGGGYSWIAIPPELEVRALERPVRAAIEIRSDAPIVVYAFNTQRTTTDAYTAIPVPNWGTEYVIASFPNDAYTPRPGDTTNNRLRDLALRRSEWMLVAAYDSTIVTFIPRSRTATGKEAGIPHTVVLNRGECYLVQSDSTPKGLGDMTGTLIRSSKPVGVLSGHVRISLPLNLPSDVDTKDHLVEMLPPVSALGQRYISTPFAVGTGDWFRAIAAFPQTRVRLTRAATGQITETILQSAGDVADFPAEASPILWEADKPFLLVQLMYSAVIGGAEAVVNPYVSFDPCMVIVPPVEQHIQQAHFFIPDTSLSGFNQFKRHWINLTVSADAVSTLRLNGTPITTVAPELLSQQLPWTFAGGVHYHWVQLRMEPGRVYQLQTPVGAFAGILYGTGYVDSYALVLGSGLLPAGQGRDTVPPRLSLRTTVCGSVELQASDSASGIAWIQVLPDSTWNYDWQYSQLTRTEAIITAQPVDLARDGQLFTELRDNAGNRRWFRYRYWAPRLEWQPTSVEFLGISPYSTKCQSVTLRNIGQDTLHIVELTFRDSRLSVQADLPLSLPPQALATFRVCFRPNGNVRPLRDTLRVRTACNVAFAISVEGTVDSVGLSARGCSAGAVLVGAEGRCSVWWANTGNRPLQVQGVRARRGENAFSLDTVGIFPTSLANEDTLRISVYFRPPQRGLFWEELELETNPPTAVAVRIEGRGIAPEVKDITIDWGRRRIGRRFDSTLALLNSGDSPTEIQLMQDTGSPELGYTIPQRVRLLGGEALHAPIWFTPTQPQRYVRHLTLQSSWQPHPPISITLLGEGSAPEFYPNPINFDTVPVGNSRDSLAAVLACSGNEATVIDTLWLEGPDRTAFSFASPTVFPQQLSPGDTLRLHLRFRPLHTGSHEAFLVLRHNGQPPYPTDTLHVPLWGYGIEIPPEDTFTTRWEVRVNLPSVTTACKEFEGQLCVWNRGSTTLICDSLFLLGGLIRSLTPPLPDTIAPGDYICFTLLLDGLPSGQPSVTFRLFLHSEHFFSDTLQITPLAWEETLSIQALPQPWTIVQSNTLFLQPGGQGVLQLSGMLPIARGVTAGGQLCLLLPTNVWSIESSGIRYEVERDNTLQPGMVTEVHEHPWGFCVHLAPMSISTTEPTRWRIQLPIQAFIGDTQQYFIRVLTYPDSSDCFSGDSLSVELLLNGLCAPRLRSVSLREVPEVRLSGIFPQPASESFILHLWSSAPTSAQLQLLTLQGHIIGTWDMSLPGGPVFCKFETTNMSSGVYCMRLITATGIQQRLYVIQR